MSETVYHVAYQASLAQWHLERAVELGRAKLSVILGGIGSGKTTGGQHILRRAMSEWAPGGHFMVICPSYRTFHQVTLPEIRKFWPGEGHLWRVYSPGNHPQIEWYWGDGKRRTTSICYVRSAQDLRTVEEIRGPTLAGIWGDEVGTWMAGEAAHNLAFGRLRETPPQGFADVWRKHNWWPRAWYTGSPRWGWLNRALGVKGGMPPHAWTTGFFASPADGPMTPRTAHYIRAARTEENIHNGPDYAAMLRVMYGEDFARQELDGDFVLPSGAVYAPYHPDLHEVPHEVAMRMYQRCGTKVGGVDWGFGSAAAMVALGIDGDGRAIIVRDWSKPGHTADQMAEIGRGWEDELGIQRWQLPPDDPEAIQRWKGRIRGSVGVRGKVCNAVNAIAAGRDTERNCMRLQSRVPHPCGKPLGSWYYASDQCKGLNSDTATLRYADVGIDQERDEKRVTPKAATHRTDARRYAIHSELSVARHSTTWEAI